MSGTPGPRPIRTTMTLLLATIIPGVFLSGPVFKAAAAAAPTPLTGVPQPGEIQVQGTIRSIDVAQKRINLDVTSVVQPGGQPTALPAPRPKTITVDATTDFYIRGRSKSKLTIEQLHVGAHAVATGKDTGPGAILPARNFQAWDGQQNGAFYLGAASTPVSTPAPLPANAPLFTAVRTTPANTILWALAFSPDGKMLAGAGGNPNNPAGAKETWIWDVATGQGQTLPLIIASYTLAFSPNGKLLATGTVDGRIRIWSMPGMVLLATAGAAGKPVTSVTFSPDGGWLAVGNGGKDVTLWDIEVGKRVRLLESKVNIPGTVLFSPDGARVIAGVVDPLIYFWSSRTGELKSSFSTTASAAPKIAISPDGRYLAGGTRDGHVLVWELDGDGIPRTFSGPGPKITSIAFSPDGLLAAGSENRVVRLWTVKDGTLIHTVDAAHGGAINAVAFSPDGKWMATAGMDSLLKIWKVK